MTAQVLARGRRAGWMAVLGLHLGGYVHVVAAALGLALVFQLVPSAYLVLKFVGAAYLIWLGVRMMRRPPNTKDAPGLPAVKSTRRAFWESVTVEVLNPKTALFFLAFLPQFTDPAAAWPIGVQMLVLGVIVNVMFSSADVVALYLADRVTRAFRASEGAQTWIRRIGGGILVGLGAKLALTRT